jgi:hypothetical protein
MRSCSRSRNPLPWKPAALVAALALAAASAFLPCTGARAPFGAAGFAYADTCDSCSQATQHHVPTPEHDPEGPNP